MWGPKRYFIVQINKKYANMYTHQKEACQKSNTLKRNRETRQRFHNLPNPIGT